jgi:hypothetical protein
MKGRAKMASYPEIEITVAVAQWLSSTHGASRAEELAGAADDRPGLREGGRRGDGLVEDDLPSSGERHRIGGVMSSGRVNEVHLTASNPIVTRVSASSIRELPISWSPRSRPAQPSDGDGGTRPDRG